MQIVTLKNTKASNVNLHQYFTENSLQIDPQQYFDITGKEGWFLGSNAEFKLKQKIESVGKPLKDWDVKINYGIKTGLNQAFIITKQKRDELIAKDSKTEEIIKPILRGRDIKRYGYEFAELYVIATFPALHLNINEYPAVRDYLINFGKDRLEQVGKTLQDGTKSRKRTGNKWFETQDQIGYYKEFEKEKVVWTPVNSEYRFATVPKGFYFSNSIFMITGANAKILIAVFNSMLVRKYITFLFSSEEEYAYASKETLSEIPIPTLNTPEKQEIAKQIEALVEEILVVKSAAKKSTPSTIVDTPQEGNLDTAYIETQIDELVFQLYGLTQEEIRVVLG